MKTINIDDISKEIRYVFKCPHCDEYNESCDELKEGDITCCENCLEDIEVIND